ncbi:MAG TPA: hypothetical protein VGN26_06065 [Armatimonadota bacterium]|jgi:hypothetical protein
MPDPRWLPILALALVVGLCAPAGAGPQYLFLNRVPGLAYNQNRPESFTDALFEEPLRALGTTGTEGLRLGLSFIFSYLDGPPEAMEASLSRVLALAEKHQVPVLIVLDGQNWWAYRSDLWNWWDPTQPGYDPKNARNVEWSGWGPEHALKVAWRNWGSQIRVLPPPNLASRRYRDACRKELTSLLAVLRRWRDELPPEKRWLFPGVKIGWEASLGVNAYYYPKGNSYLEQYPKDDSHDPRTGLRMEADFAGGLVPIGHAGLTTKGWKRSGEVTLADQERVTADYLTWLSRLCHDAGFPREQVFTHCGAQFAPWKLHYSYAVGINRYATPGWSFYGVDPAGAGDLGESMDRAHRQEWCAAEWLPSASTSQEWQAAIRQTLGFRSCRFLSLYNWEGVRGNADAVAGIRGSLGR